MKKIYAKQVDPELQDSDLFYRHNNELYFNDEAYSDDVIILGNNDFKEYIPDYLYNIFKKLDDFASDIYYNRGSLSDNVNYYFKKQHHSKKWSKIELHKWCEVYNLIDNYSRDNELQARLLALKLITGKNWREVSFVGCVQSEWQNGFASDIITSKDIYYIGACYFNTGSEWIIYDNYKDFIKNDNGYYIYIDGYNKKDIADAIGCDIKKLVVYEFNGYIKKATHKLLEA